MPEEQAPPIPPNLAVALQTSGLESVIIQNMPYAGGVAGVLEGIMQDDGTIITTELQNAMSNTGLDLDSLKSFLRMLNDNLTMSVTSNPAIKHLAPFYMSLYFTFFLEYLKHFAMSPKFIRPDEFLATIKQKMPIETFMQAASMMIYNKNSYAISAKNPPGIANPISPWVYVYNDAGKTRLFLSKDEMEQYEKKYGKSLKNMLGKFLDRDNFQYTAIVAVSVIALMVAVGIFLKKKRDKNKEEEESVISELSADEGD